MYVVCVYMQCVHAYLRAYTHGFVCCAETLRSLEMYVTTVLGE